MRRVRRLIEKPRPVEPFTKGFLQSDLVRACRPNEDQEFAKLRPRSRRLRVQEGREHCLLDFTMLQVSQLFLNVLDNAVKHGGSAEVSAKQVNGEVQIRIRDHGPGIPLADRKHAVERFVRLEASRTQPGSGLGLSLASAVATLHGGDLRFDDAHPGLIATLAIPALSGAGDGLAAQTHDVPQKAA